MPVKKNGQSETEQTDDDRWNACKDIEKQTEYFFTLPLAYSAI